MVDPALVFARWTLYVGLMAGFGLPMFALHALRGHAGARVTRRLLQLAAGASVLGLIATIFGMWAMARGMGGGDAAATWAIILTLLTQTTVGTTWILRVMLLLLAVGSARAPVIPVRVRTLLSTVLGAGALATLAWGGHAAMSEGARAWLHLGADVAHLLVAGAWFGALVAFVLVAQHASAEKTAASVRLLADTAQGFARLGSAIVAILLVSGTINYVLIVGPTPSGLIANAYGRLLLVKLGLFAGMLLLATANRFRFAPAVAQALREGDAAGAVATLRRSLRMETGLAFAVLILVAGLGTMDPSA
jgi:putative copper resistance protein D